MELATDKDEHILECAKRALIALTGYLAYGDARLAA
jgi:hypothetical protein